MKSILTVICIILIAGLAENHALWAFIPLATIFVINRKSIAQHWKEL